MNKKKLLALLMALVMTLTLVPVTVIAEELETVTPIAEPTEAVAVESVSFEAMNAVEPTDVAKIGNTGYSTLDAAVAAANPGDTITLLKDVTYGVDHEIDVWVNNFNLDLNGHIFTTNSDESITQSNNGYKAGAICYGEDNLGSITVSNGTIRTAYGAGIYLAGENTSITLTGLTVQQNYPGNVQTTAEYSTALRVSSKGTAVIQDGTYTGKYAIAVSNSGGTVTVNGGTFTGGIFFNTNTNSKVTKTITINGGTFHKNNDEALFVNPTCGNLVITGGTFDDDPSAYVAQGYMAVNNGNDTWTVRVNPETAVAKIDETYFATLGAAVAAANETGNCTVSLLCDYNLESNEPGLGSGYWCAESENVQRDNSLTISGNNITLDLGGFELSNLFNMAFLVTGENVTIQNGSMSVGELYDHALGSTTALTGESRICSYVMGVENAKNFVVNNLTTYGGINVWGSTATVTINNLHFSGTKFYAVCSQEGASVTLNGGTFDKSMAGSGKNLFYVGSDEANSGDSYLYITGGNYLRGSSAGFSVNGHDAHIVITGGFYDKQPSATYVADGYEAVALTSGTEFDAGYLYTVTKSGVAQIGNNKYTTLKDAFDAANEFTDAVTINVLQNCTLDNTVTVQAGKNVTLNLNGKTVGSTMNGADADDVMIAIEAGATMTVTGNGVITNQVGGTTYSRGLIHNAGTLTVNGGTFNDYGQGRGYALKNSGTMTVKAGTRIESFGTASGNAAIYNVTGKLNIEDGVTIVNHATDKVVDEARFGKNGYGVYAIRIDAGTTTIGTLNAVTPTTVDGNRGAFAVNGGTLVINSGVFTGHIYRAMWITNDYAGTSVTINGGTFVPGTYGSVGASVDDGRQDNSDVAVTVNDGYFGGKFYHDTDRDSVNAWTFAIKGGCYTVAPSANLIADGYEAVAINKEEGGITYNWQVGKVKATDLTQTEITDNSATFTAQKQVVDSADENEVLSSNNTLNVTVTGYTGAETNTVAQATLDNVMSTKLEKIVSDAIVAAGSGITSSTTQANVVIQVAKSTPNTSTQGKVSYEVHPEAVISVNNVKVGTVPLTNDQIDGTFNFKLNVSSIANPGEYVRIDHMENNAVLDSKTYKVGSDHCVEISGITRFSIFVGEKVDKQNESFAYLGASVRRRVEITNEYNVVNSCTDMRFGFVVKDYEPFGYNDNYYFRWKKEGGNWSTPVNITNFANTDGEWVASLVITNIPRDYFNTTITAEIYKDDQQNTLSSGDGMSVIQVANAIITKYGNGTSQQQWVDYARYLKATNGSYTVTYDDNNRVNGYTYTAQ